MDQTHLVHSDDGASHVVASQGPDTLSPGSGQEQRGLSTLQLDGPEEIGVPVLSKPFDTFRTFTPEDAEAVHDHRQLTYVDSMNLAGAQGDNVDDAVVRSISEVMSAFALPHGDDGDRLGELEPPTAHEEDNHVTTLAQALLADTSSAEEDPLVRWSNDASSSYPFRSFHPVGQGDICFQQDSSLDTSDPTELHSTMAEEALASHHQAWSHVDDTDAMTSCACSM
jgi:hypothetical protein